MNEDSLGSCSWKYLVVLSVRFFEASARLFFLKLSLVGEVDEAATGPKDAVRTLEGVEGEPDIIMLCTTRWYVEFGYPMPIRFN